MLLHTHSCTLSYIVVIWISGYICVLQYRSVLVLLYPISGCCIYLHGNESKRVRQAPGKAAAWQHGRAPNLAIHPDVYHVAGRSILRLGRRDHHRTRGVCDSIPCGGGDGRQLWAARDDKDRSCVVAQRPPSLRLNCSRAAGSEPDGGDDQAGRPAGLLAPPPRSHACSAAGISFAAIRYIGCRQLQPSTPGQDPNGTVHACS